MPKKWNVPGNSGYNGDDPVDLVLQATTDQVLRGYWLARDAEGQLLFVSNNSAADGVSVGEAPDGTPLITISESTTELTFDGNSIRMKRYS